MKKLIDCLLHKQFFRFMLVGAFNTLFGTAVMFGAYNLLHLGYWVSSAANYVLGSILSFFLNRSFTFRSTRRGPKQAVRFAANIAICYFVAYGVARPAVVWLFAGLEPTLRDNVAMAAGMVLFVLLNYVGQRFMVFAHPMPNDQDHTSSNNRGDACNASGMQSGRFKA